MAINNPLIPGDPFSYDLKWIVRMIRKHSAYIETLDETISQRIEDLVKGREITMLESAVKMSENAPVDAVIFTAGYYEKGDDGAAMYITRARDPYDVEDGGSVIFCGEDVTALLVPFTGSVNSAQFGCRGTQEDGEHFQKMIDWAIQAGLPTIGIVNVNLTGTTILLDKTLHYPDDVSTRSRRKMKFTGVNGKGFIFKQDAGFMFSSSTRAGDIAFDNINFEGYATLGTNASIIDVDAFDCDALIRLTVTNCSFCWFRNVYRQTGTTNATNAQSIFSSQNTYVHNKTVFMACIAYDCAFVNDLMEEGNSGLECAVTGSTSRWQKVRVISCDIESMLGNGAIYAPCIANLSVNDCYFEDNRNHITVNWIFSGTIKGNEFHGRTNIPASENIACIKVGLSGRAVTIDGNVCTDLEASTTLIYIDTNAPQSNVGFGILGNNNVEGSGSAVLTNLPARVYQSNLLPRYYATATEIDIMATLQAAFPAITGGTAKLIKKNGVIIIALNNLTTNAAITGGTSAVIQEAVGYTSQAINAAIHTEGANGGRVFSNGAGQIGIRVPSAGTYSGELVIV